MHPIHPRLINVDRLSPPLLPLHPGMAGDLPFGLPLNPAAWLPGQCRRPDPLGLSRPDFFSISGDREEDAAIS